MLGGECVCFRLTGLPTKVLQHAASNCFWQIPKYQLDKLARSLSVPVSADLFQLLVSLVQKVFPEHSPEMVSDILALRSKKKGDLTSADISDEILADLVDKDEQADFQELCLHPLCTVRLK